MPLLLSLPRELRDEILDDVIQSRIPVPSAPTSVDGRDVPRSCCGVFKGIDDFPHPKRRTAVKYITEPNAYRPNTLGLLLTNHQLHDECVSRLRTLNPPYQLDIKIVSENELWPTWTCIPTAPAANNPVDVVATLQAVGEGPKKPSQSGFMKHYSPSRLEWAFTVLLLRFLRHGPVGPIADDAPYTKVFQEGNVIVKTLHINCTSPNVDSGADGHWVTPPVIASVLSDRIRLTEVYPVRFGDLLYRRIGRIVITLDGVHFRTWDLADQLRWAMRVEARSCRNTPRTSGPGFTSEEQLKTWFTEVCEMRRMVGLEAPSEEYWEL